MPNRQASIHNKKQHQKQYQQTAGLFQDKSTLVLNCGREFYYYTFMNSMKFIIPLQR